MDRLDQNRSFANQQKTTNFAFYIVFTVVLFIFGIVLGYFLNEYVSNDHNQVVEVEEGGDDLSNLDGWKTYENEQYGYSISYPSSYHVGDENKRNLFNYDEDKMEFIKGNPDGVKIQVQPQINATDHNLADVEQRETFISELNENIQGSPTEDMETTIKPVSLGNVKYSNNVLRGPGGPFEVYYAFLSDGQNYFKILVWGAENDRENVEKILSSFSS